VQRVWPRKAFSALGHVGLVSIGDRSPFQLARGLHEGRAHSVEPMECEDVCTGYKNCGSGNRVRNGVVGATPVVLVYML
jgi:hypothetical protein